MKNSNINVGDTVIAKAYCGFPDDTTKDKEYEVTKTEDMIHLGQRLFWIINDKGKEVLPVSTVFKVK